MKEERGFKNWRGKRRGADERWRRRKDGERKGR